MHSRHSRQLFTLTGVPFDEQPSVESFPSRILLVDYQVLVTPLRHKLHTYSDPHKMLLITSMSERYNEWRCHDSV